ncbi:MAG: glycosyltransferase family 4 protein [Desulfobacteraceae bacterium]|nr:glycosyltransferase family 4 protein [Desulfobacteraceae bacterium]
MKIAYLSSSAIPSRTANSIHVMKMCQAFAKNGHEVKLFAPNKKNDLEAGIEDVFAFYGVEKCFELKKLFEPPVKGGRFIHGYLAARQAWKMNADIAYCRNLIAGAMAARMGVYTIFESHSPNPGTRFFFDNILQTKPWNVDLNKIVVITSALKAYYESNYPQISGKILVAPDGADPVPEDIPPVRLTNKGKRLQVGYVGHLYKGKGMELISKLARQAPWADFQIVGGLKQDLVYWKTKCADCENIFFHGFVSHNKTFHYLKAFDIVLLPTQKIVAAHSNPQSNIAMWTSPLKVFEYMASGRPIVSSDLPALREVLTHGENALLCPPDDTSAWIQAIRCLKNNTEIREKLAEKALEIFLNNFTWRARAEKVISEVPE